MKKKVFIAVSVILLLVMTSILFVACTSDKDNGHTPDFDTLKATFEENGYTVEAITGKDLMAEEKGSIEKILYAYKEEEEEYCTITWYTSSEKAKYYYDAGMEEYEPESGSVILLKGKAIIAATEKTASLIK